MFDDVFRELPGGFAAAGDGVSGEGGEWSCEGCIHAGV